MHYCEIRVQVRHDGLAQVIRSVFEKRPCLQRGPRTLLIRDDMLPFDNADTYSLDREHIGFCPEALENRFGDDTSKWRADIARAFQDWLSHYADVFIPATQAPDSETASHVLHGDKTAVAGIPRWPSTNRPKADT